MEIDLTRRKRDGSRSGFAALSATGLRWNSLPMRLFAGGNAKFWDPADIDFSQDAKDWAQLDEREQRISAILCASFIAGEEAVTEDIQPFIQAMAAEERLEDEMYLTQFAFEEAKHVQVFRMWMDAVGLNEDLHHLVEDNPGYRRIFYEELPRALGALKADPSPTAQVKAAVVYNHVVEGTLALTGYHAWRSVCVEREIMPGMQTLIQKIGNDERRHMAWGTFTCRRHVAADDSNWQVVESTMNELLTPALELVSYPFSLFGDDVPFGLSVDDFVEYAMQKGTRRLGAIESARGRSIEDIDYDFDPMELEERMAAEDAAA